MGYGLKFAFFETFGIFGNLQRIDDTLDVSVHEGREVIDGIADTMVGDTALRVVIGTDLGTTVAGRDHGLSARRDVIDIFLVLLIIYLRAQA